MKLKICHTIRVRMRSFPFQLFFLAHLLSERFPPVGHHRAFLGSSVYGGHLELMDICHSTMEAPLLLVSISSYRRGRWRKNIMKS